MNSENKPTFNYFPANSKGTVIRAIFDYKDVSFEDNQIQLKDWPQEKPKEKYEFHQIPTLDWNGKHYSQTVAIEIYLGRKFNLLGTNPEEEYEIISLLCSRDDLYKHLYPILMPMTEDHKNSVQQNTKKFLEEGAPFLLRIFEERFKKFGGKYAVGDTFSLADIYLTAHLANVFLRSPRTETWEPILLANAPTLAAHIKKIKENELANYFKNRVINTDI